MADNPELELIFAGKCPDCAERRAALPEPLPAPGDDFDWQVRDYEGFRRFMLEELAARFPQRRRWTSADLEMVLVEAFAAVLDQFSDMLDRSFRETFLETAQRPESVRRLLALIGYDTLGLAKAAAAPPFAEEPGAGETRSDTERFDLYWLRHPEEMERARRAGPRLIRTQRRMVTEQDYADRLAEHPLVLRAHAWSAWEGAWTVIRTAVICWDHLSLEDTLPPEQGLLAAEIDRFHRERGLPTPVWGEQPPLRAVLRILLDAFRMAGQEARLDDAIPVGILIDLTARIRDNYYQSEVRRALESAFGTGAAGFFRPGRRGFGEDLFAGDIFQQALALDGVEAVCLNRFKRIGRRFPNQADAGRILLKGLEYPLCENDRSRPQRGYFTIRIQGGKKG
jgi:hypothetical protein